MPRPVLFITRSWHGKGGLQQLSHDLWHSLEQVYGERFTGVRPERAGVTGLMGLCVRAVRVAFSLRGSRPFIHLGDAALLPLGYLLALIGNGTLSVTACGLDVIYPAGWYQFVMRRFWKRVDRVVCISGATREAVMERGVPPQKTIIIPCGINDVPVSLNHERSMLLSIGRLVPRKGVAWFVEQVMPLILQHIPGVRYIVCGTGPEEERIRAAIERLHLQKSVILMTDCSDDERDTLMGRASVFVMPNVKRAGDMEGFGIVCIEASARGTPVAAARMEGMLTAVREGETGVLFEPENAQDCARVIIGVLQHPMDPVLIAASTHTHFSWPSLISRYTRDVFAD